MAPKVWVVLDGEYRFGNGAMPPGTQDFTYITLVDALTAAGMQVTKAHRASDSTANLQNFTFDGAGVNLLEYDVIWLIGYVGRNSASIPPSGSSTVGGLGASQLNAIANFMDHGGGVFATGDHDSIAADLCGHIPRVRAMRCWFGQNDAAKPAGLTAVPDNFPPLSTARADTTRPNPAGVYTEHPAPFVWFENQSDSVPQPIAPSTSPAHPILRRGGADITVYPDHMHEGQTLGTVAGHDYAQNSPFGNTTKAEFREIAGHREMPPVIAQGTVAENANRSATGGFTDPAIAALQTINALNVYDGRVAGVGRIVTGATFHHCVDINLTGDTDVVAGPIATKVGPDGIKGHGSTTRRRCSTRSKRSSSTSRTGSRVRIRRSARSSSAARSARTRSRPIRSSRTRSCSPSTASSPPSSPAAAFHPSARSQARPRGCRRSRRRWAFPSRSSRRSSPATIRRCPIACSGSRSRIACASPARHSASPARRATCRCRRRSARPRSPAR